MFIDQHLVSSVSYSPVSCFVLLIEYQDSVPWRHARDWENGCMEIFLGLINYPQYSAFSMSLEVNCWKNLPVGSQT